MRKATKKAVEISYMTWEDLVKYGAEQNPESAKDHNGLAWSFELNGYSITNENDECYLIPTLEGIHNMTPKDVLIIGVKGEIYPCKIDIFEMTYDFSESTFFDRLLKETQELAEKTNKLNDFMRTNAFVELDRKNKDLLYSQSRTMNKYLQILSKRIELLGEQFTFKK